MNRRFRVLLLGALPLATTFLACPSSKEPTAGPTPATSEPPAGASAETRPAPPAPGPQATETPEVSREQAVARVLMQIQQGVPKGEGPEADAARTTYFRESRTPLDDFARAHPGTNEALIARVFRATLSLASGDAQDATITLRDVLHEIGDSRDGEKLMLRVQALDWLAQANPSEARPLLAKARDEMPEASAAQVERILRKLDANERLAVDRETLPFEVHDLGGETLTPASFRGKVLLLHFWASGDAASIAEVRALRDAYAGLHGKGLEVLSVSMDGATIRSVPGGREPAGPGLEGLRAFTKAFEMPWRHAWDGKGFQGDLAQIYAVTEKPRSIVLDREGRVRVLRDSLEVALAKVAELLE